MRRRAMLGAIALTLGACSRPTPGALGPAACEPPEELQVERALKEGFKGLVTGEGAMAQRAFMRAAALAPGAPEVMLGLRLVTETREERRTSGERRARGWLRVADVRVPLRVPLRNIPWDFAEFDAMEEARAALSGQGVALPVVRSRGGAPELEPRAGSHGVDAGVATSEAEARAAAWVSQQVNLVILREVPGLGFREAFVGLQVEQSAAHFVINESGDVAQGLDLGWTFQVTGDPTLDARSIVVALIQGPGPGGSASEPQLRGLAELLRALTDVLPRLELTLPDPATPLPPTSRVGIIEKSQLEPAGADASKRTFPWRQLEAILSEIQ